MNQNIMAAVRFKSKFKPRFARFRSFRYTNPKRFPSYKGFKGRRISRFPVWINARILYIPYPTKAIVLNLFNRLNAKDKNSRRKKFSNYVRRCRFQHVNVFYSLHQRGFFLKRLIKKKKRLKTKRLSFFGKFVKYYLKLTRIGYIFLRRDYKFIEFLLIVRYSNINFYYLLLYLKKNFRFFSRFENERLGFLIERSKTLNQLLSVFKNRICFSNYKKLKLSGFLVKFSSFYQVILLYLQNSVGLGKFFSQNFQKKLEMSSIFYSIRLKRREHFYKTKEYISKLNNSTILVFNEWTRKKLYSTFRKKQVYLKRFFIRKRHRIRRGKRLPRLKFLNYLRLNFVRTRFKRRKRRDKLKHLKRFRLKARINRKYAVYFKRYIRSFFRANYRYRQKMILFLGSIFFIKYSSILKQYQFSISSGFKQYFHLSFFSLFRLNRYEFARLFFYNRFLFDHYSLIFEHTQKILRIFKPKRRRGGGGLYIRKRKKRFLVAVGFNSNLSYYLFLRHYGARRFALLTLGYGNQNSNKLNNRIGLQLYHYFLRRYSRNEIVFSWKNLKKNYIWSNVLLLNYFKIKKFKLLYLGIRSPLRQDMDIKSTLLSKQGFIFLIRSFSNYILRLKFFRRMCLRFLLFILIRKLLNRYYYFRCLNLIN